MNEIIRWFLNEFVGKSLFRDARDVLSYNPFDQASTSGIITTIYEAVSVFAMMLMFIYFLTGIVDKMSSEQFSWEQLWRHLAMLLGAYLLIINGLEIMSILMKLGIGLIDQVGEAAEIADMQFDVDALMDDFEGGITSAVLKLLSGVIFLILSFVPALLCLLMSLCVRIIVYSRLLELCVRVCFAPVALSDFFKNGFQGNGWRFLKAFFAVCIQGALIAVIMLLYGEVLYGYIEAGSITSLSTLFGYIGNTLVIGIAAIALMFRSLSLSKELMGVN